MQEQADLKKGTAKEAIDNAEKIMSEKVVSQFNPR